MALLNLDKSISSSKARVIIRSSIAAAADDEEWAWIEDDDGAPNVESRVSQFCEERTH